MRPGPTKRSMACYGQKDTPDYRAASPQSAARRTWFCPHLDPKSCSGRRTERGQHILRSVKLALGRGRSPTVAIYPTQERRGRCPPGHRRSGRQRSESVHSGRDRRGSNRGRVSRRSRWCKWNLRSTRAPPAKKSPSSGRNADPVATHQRRGDGDDSEGAATPGSVDD